MPWDVSFVASFFMGSCRMDIQQGREIYRKLHPHDFISEQNNSHQNQVCRYFR